MISGSKALVYVSAFAVFACPVRPLVAAPTISCTRGISFGTFLPVCNGEIIVRGSAASGTVNNGCHSQISGPILPARCQIQTTIGIATQDIRVTFPTASVQFANGGGGGQVTLDSYLIETAGGSAAGSYTFAASIVNPTHSFNVGGRLRFNANEPSGSYSSSMNVVITSIP